MRTVMWIIAAIVIGAPWDGWACSCVPDSPCSRFAGADAVFLGHVLAVGREGDDGVGPGDRENRRQQRDQKKQRRDMAAKALAAADGFPDQADAGIAQCVLAPPGKQPDIDADQHRGEQQQPQHLRPDESHLCCPGRLRRLRMIVFRLSRRRYGRGACYDKSMPCDGAKATGRWRAEPRKIRQSRQTTRRRPAQPPRMPAPRVPARRSGGKCACRRCA